jgi:GT2 family glycosyltransferase
MSRISLILLNYNSTDLTRACIDSLLAFKDKKDEYSIIVWDNKSLDAPRLQDFSDVDLVLSQKNDGFAGGNNKAASYAIRKYKPDFLLFLNNDTRVTHGMVRTMVERFQSDKNAGIVVPKIYFEKNHEFFRSDYSKEERGNVIWYAGGGIDWKNMMLFHLGVDEVDRGQFDEHTQTSFAAGTAMLTTPQLWKKLKGFDAAYFLYYEDADLSMRLQKKHKKIIYEPRALLYHINAGSTSGSGSSLHQYYQTRNRLRFGLQYASSRTKLALLKEAWRLYKSGTPAQRRGVLHALEGKWGKQPVV